MFQVKLTHCSNIALAHGSPVSLDSIILGVSLLLLGVAAALVLIG